MKVGTIVSLKEPILGNSKGTKGIVYYDYGYGIQAIFANGEYDGFDPEEQSKYLSVIGFDEQVASYNFRNVIQLSKDFEQGVFKF